MARAKARTVFPKGDIPHVVRAIVNGTITNDKFCMSRMRQFQFLPARKVVTQEVHYPSESNAGERSFQEETDETTAVERSALHYRDNRRSSQVGSSLPVSSPMECSISKRETADQGEQR
jgi:hypothetical protein